MLVLLFTNVVSLLALPLLQNSSLWADPRVLMWMLLALNTLLLACGLLLIRPILKRPTLLPFRRLPAFSKLLRMSVVSLCIAYLFSLLTNLLASLFSSITGQFLSNPLLPLLSFSSPLAILLFIVLLSPIVEELLFRGFILSKLQPYGDGVAILGSALLFALYHCNLFQFFYAFALGVLFAYCALRTENLLVPIFLHILVNFFGSFLPMLFLYGNQAVWVVLNFFLMLFCIVFGLVFLFSSRKSFRLPPGSSPISPFKKIDLFFQNAGLICFFLFCLLITFSNLFA